MNMNFKRKLPTPKELKELYPLEGCMSERKDTNVIWLSEEKKDYYIPQFENLYKRQIHFQNITNFTNSSTQIIDNIYDAFCKAIKELIYEMSII